MGNTSVNELLTSYLTCKKCGTLYNPFKDVTYHLKFYKLESMDVMEEPTTYCLCSKCYNNFLEWILKKEDCPKEDTNQKTLLGLNITGATLLTDKEAEQLPQRLREYKKWWWLMSSGITSNRAAFVFDDGSIGGFGRHVFYIDGIVRPALIISNLELSDLKIGDTFKFGDKEFEIVSDDKAFCLTDIGNCAFEGAEVPNANDYEKSDVKRRIDAWFEKAKENIHESN